MRSLARAQIVALTLLAETGALIGQSNSAVADRAVSVAFQNADGATVQQGVSVAFQNSAFGSVGAGVTVFFQGQIYVSTNLAAASFTISGPVTYNGSGTLFNQASAPPGAYKITFSPVSGYRTPAPQTQTLATGGSIAFSGTYSPLPVLSLYPSALAFIYQQQISGPPSPQTLTVFSSGPTLNFTAQASVTGGTTWLGVTPANGSAGTSGTTLSVSINPLGLAVGTYTGQVTISAPAAATSPLVAPVTLTVVTLCTPPQNFYTDATGTGGFGDAAVSNIQIGQCSTQASVQIQSSVAAWLGVVMKAPQTTAFAPDLSAGPAGVAATFGLVPPCSTNLVQCTSPGLAQWVVTATSSGLTEIDLAMTPSAACINLAGAILGSGVTSIATVVNVGNELYAAAPDFKAAADCFAAGPSLGNAVCITDSMIALSLNQQELHEAERILKSAGINVTLKALVTDLLDASVTAIQEIGTLSVMYYQTGLLGHLAVEVIDLQAQ
jgi:hypothetical protein